jgi:hypothetical protein
VGKDAEVDLGEMLRRWGDGLTALEIHLQVEAARMNGTGMAGGADSSAAFLSGEAESEPQPGKAQDSSARD